MDSTWHSQSLDELFLNLKSSAEGLTSQLAEDRLKLYGYNRLSNESRFLWMRLLWRQIYTPFVLILFIAATVKYLSAGWIDGSVILITLVLMVIIGFIQEMKAEKTLALLKNLNAHRCKVKRNGTLKTILSESLVPGDIILLEIGDKVPADARLIHVTSLKTNESMLSGESLPLEKEVTTLDEKIPLAERKNMVYSGSVIVYGKAEALVVSTGMETEVGKIAQSIQEVSPQPTPIEKDLHSIGRWMIGIILFAIGIFAVLSLHSGMDVLDVFVLGVAAMVSAIPEGIPAAFAVTLAVGMHLMSRRNVIVRKISAVETLGSTTVICSDKTGTLTCNQIKVLYLYTAEKLFSLEQENNLYQKMKICRLALEIGALCNDARIVEKRKGLDFLGDPTETSLLTASLEMGCDVKNLLSAHPRIGEIPFTSDTFYMATLHRIDSKTVVYIKGAPEKILSFCNRILTPAGLISLENENKNQIEKTIFSMTQNALRVIGVAYLELGPQIYQLQESLFAGKLVFVGLFGMIDPPRKEAIDAIALCKMAEIRVVMITGDNPQTATAIGKLLAIPSNHVVTGKNLAETSDEDLSEIVKTTSIFARVEPAHKLRIVRALQANGQIVSMTGDGINDAPALEAANIGIAMGLTGSDVAKEAADVVLADDRFDSIVAAIEEGRAIFNRLRNICALLLTTSFGELIGLILCVAFLKTAPLIASQILWVNLIAGSLVAIPLGLEPKTGREMLIPPRDPKSRLIYIGMLYRVLSISLLLGVCVFFLLYHLLNNISIVKARSMIVTAVILFEWVAAVEMRSDELPFWKLNPLKNKSLILVLVIVICAHLGILYIPSFQFLFQTVALPTSDWLIVILPACALIILESLRKTFFPHLFEKGKIKNES